MLSLSSRRLVSYLQPYVLGTNTCLNATSGVKNTCHGSRMYEIFPTHTPHTASLSAEPYGEADGTDESGRRRVGLESMDPSPLLLPSPWLPEHDGTDVSFEVFSVLRKSHSFTIFRTRRSAT